MAVRIWEPQYSVGVTEMDGHHKKMLNMMRHVADALREGKAKTAVLALADEMDRYTKYHFFQEELHMKRFNYNRVQNQQEEHQRILRKMDQLRHCLETGDCDQSLRLMDEVNETFIQHICGEDAGYGEVFQQNGFTVM